VIYMVEHTFSRPDMEADWHAWYSGNVQVLLGVPGIHTAQRFRVPDTQPPRYMAMYTVDAPGVFETEAYKKAGGGGTNSARFRPAYQVWIRNIFDGIATAPAVPMGSRLLVVDAPAPDRPLAGVELAWGKSAGLHATTAFRGLGVADVSMAQRVGGAADITVYEPMTPQHGKSTAG
jgi:hypothetical protein